MVKIDETIDIVNGITLLKLKHVRFLGNIDLFLFLVAAFVTESSSISSNQDFLKHQRITL